MFQSTGVSGSHLSGIKFKKRPIPLKLGMYSSILGAKLITNSHSTAESHDRPANTVQGSGAEHYGAQVWSFLPSSQTVHLNSQTFTNNFGKDNFWAT